MKVTDHLKTPGVKFSFELTPPKYGKSRDVLFRKIEELKDFYPSFIDVTYHPEDLVKVGNNGSSELKPVCKKPGTMMLCAAIESKYGIDTVPHLICSTFDKWDTEYALIDAYHGGMESVVALKGDAPKDADGKTLKFTPKKDGYEHAIDLVLQIKSMNEGRYVDENLIDPEPTDFCIGVACYPDKHPEAQTFDKDLERFAEKASLADYAITQMFFDVDRYELFLELAERKGVTIPIVPGMKVVDKIYHVIETPGKKTLQELFGCHVPKSLYRAIERCKTDEDAAKAGVEYATMQCEELIKLGAPDLHFFVYESPKPVARVMENISGYREVTGDFYS